jgi:hypothetical protein
MFALRHGELAMKELEYNSHTFQQHLPLSHQLERGVPDR